jgi:hypothetical protein
MEGKLGKTGRRSAFLPPLSLNRRLRDPGCLPFAGL